MHKSLTIVAGLAFAATSTFIISNAASATQPDPDHKSWVCKYVGKPGVDERFSHLIWVDVAATQGSWFKDGQNNSYVLKADAPREPKPDESLCPKPPVTEPTPEPTDTPTTEPSDQPSDQPTDNPSEPSQKPTNIPTPWPTHGPPTPEPTTAGPTLAAPPTSPTPQVAAPVPATPKTVTPKAPKHRKRAHTPSVLPDTGA